MGDRIPSYCRLCEAVCGTIVEVEDGAVVRITGDPEHPVSKGYLCPKGAAFAKAPKDPDRILHALKRTGAPGEFTEVTWDEALEDIAERTRRSIEVHGPDSIAMYCGNPTAYSLAHMTWSKGFLDAIGSPHLYSAAAQDTLPRQAASWHLYRSPFLFPIPDIPRTQFLLILGANPWVSHGSLLTLPSIKDELRAIPARGGRVVVVDPARTRTAEQFEHLAVRPGTDNLLLAAMINVIFTEGLDDATTSVGIRGAPALRDAVAPVTREIAAAATGVDAETIAGLARDFAAAPSAVAYSRAGLCRAPNTTVTNYLVDALSIVTGNFDREGGLVFGDAPIDFVNIADRAGMATFGKHRTRIGGFPDIAGHLAWVLPDEITTPGRGQVRVLYVTAGNPVLSAPDGDKFESALDQLNLLVSFDLYINETNRHADYILPGPTFLEREDLNATFGGHMPRPFLQATRAVVPAPPDVREEWSVYEELARRIGLGAAFGQRPIRLLSKIGIHLSARRVLDSMVRISSIGDRFGLRRRGLNLQKLLDRHPHGLALADHVRVGRANHYVRHEDGRVDLGNPEVLNQLGAALLSQADPDHPFLLIGRRDLRSLNSWLHNLRATGDEPTLHVHPTDAAALALADGGRAAVSSSTATLDVLVEVTDSIRPGTVSYPHGWGHAGGWQNANARGGANVNRLATTTAPTRDSLTGASHLDGIPVQVQPRA